MHVQELFFVDFGFDLVVVLNEWELWLMTLSLPFWVTQSYRIHVQVFSSDKNSKLLNFFDSKGGIGVFNGLFGTGPYD